jgi:hypothetical protein
MLNFLEDSTRTSANVPMMTNRLWKRSVFSWAVAGLVLFCLTSVHAQKRKVTDQAAVRYARSFPVSKLERGLPSQRFDLWLRKLAGKRARISWEVNDCGEQTGSPADRGRDVPMCVEATALSFDLHISVSLGIGTFRRGINSPRPDVRLIVLGSEGEESVYPDTLVELDKKLRELTGRP